MIEYIVYESNTGFTQQYAEMLAEEVGLPAIRLRESMQTIPEKSEIFFIGWVCGGKIYGLPIAQSRFTIVGAAAVGIVHPKPEVVDNLIQMNGIDDEVHGIDGPFFYLQGGVDPKKLGWMKRKILSLIANNMMKNVSKDSSDWDVADALKMGGTFVKKENLQPIIAWFKD